MKPVKHANDMSEAEKCFWNRYAQVLIDMGIVEKAGSYSVLRAQQFVYGLNGTRLKEVDEQTVRNWLDDLGA